MTCVVFALAEDRLVDMFAFAADVGTLETALRAAGNSNIVASPSRTVALPAVTLKRPGGDVAIAGTTVSFDAVATDVVTDAAMTLVATDLNTGPNLSGRHQYLGPTVTVVRTSDSATLVEGADYSVNRERGVILRIGGSDFGATVSYTGYQHRYDYVVADGETGALSIVKGTDRIVDPEAFKAEVPTGSILVWTAYVWRDGVDLIPSYRFRNGIHLDRLADHIETLEYNRQALRRVIAKSRKAEAVKIVSYGDSIVEIGSAKDAYSFFGRFPADSLALIDRYNADGTSNPSGTKIHVGWNWFLKAALERHGSAVTYVNLGVGGTTSASTTGNGLDPSRLNAALDEDADLVNIHFGMNQLASTATYAEVYSLIRQFQARGADVLVTTPPRRNSWHTGSTLSQWLKTHDRLTRAARDAGAAIVSMHEILGPGNEGAFGLSPKNMCNQNILNHPGPTEYGLIGAYIQRIID